ncbi:MAG: hypothetical protein OEM94_06605, partial [Acidimicrobiia bacterium]|nr:hypothetical protein [Acidimicrobiia bacterium]
MTEFTVHLVNRPGALATLTEQLADAGIAIEALAAFGVDGEGMVRLMVNDPTLTRKILERDEISYEEREVLITTLPHEPDAVAMMTRSLADAGANIDAMYLLRSSAEGLEFAIAVDNHDVAHNTLAV